MYSWSEDTSTWYGKKKYSYAPAASATRKAAAERERVSGPRTYADRQGPNEKIVSPEKHIRSSSANPIIVAIDVTGSMSTWPAEIFDRLPLMYNTLSQYRPDVEISFAAIGDASVDHWPLQVTTFAGGYDLEQLLGSLYGEGGGGDAPESYGLFAQWVNTHVEIPNVQEIPFLIVFGDINMHSIISKEQVRDILGDNIEGDLNSINIWQEVSKKWNTWFLRRPTQSRNDIVDKQWGNAIGDQKVFHLEDEQRAVDYAMGLIARSWGSFNDFQDNMRARQSEEKVVQISKPIEMICPRCGGPIPVSAGALFTCKYCGTTLRI